VRIRRARVEDVEELAVGMKVVVDEDRWLATQSDRTVEQLREMFRSGLEEGHILFALKDGRRIVGAVGVHPTRVRGVHSLGMWILAEHRGEGSGRRLLDAALEAARGEGIRKLELEVFPDNVAAIALYASAGFEVEGLRRGHYERLDGSLRSTLLMARFV
jgi:RimJ/RimL family protein N-acetyltransferase